MASDLIRRAEAYLCSPEAMTAADDLISDLLAALKAQQPSSAGQTAPAVTQGDNGGKGFTVTQIHGKEATLAGGGGGVVGSGGGATYLVEVQGGGKAQQPSSAGQSYQVAQGGNGKRGFIIKNLQGTTSWVGGGGGGQGGGVGQVYSPAHSIDHRVSVPSARIEPAPVDAEGLPPPLPEPIGVLHRGNGGEWWFSCGDNLRNLYAQPMGEHNLYTSDQLRRAQREAMAVERERCAQTIDDMPSETGWIGKMDAARKLRQGAKT